MKKKIRYWSRCALTWLQVRQAVRKSALGTADLARFRDALEGQLPSGPTVLAACDETYYWRFATAFLDSVQRAGGSDHVHLHLYWPSHKVIDDLQRRAGDASLTWTIDRSTLAETLPYPVVYMTVARFIVAHLIVSNGSPVLVIDIDAIAKRPIWPAVEVAASGDVGLYFRPKARKLWRKILASGVIINPTEAGCRFADVMARSTLTALATRPRTHIDQVLLYYVSKRCKAEYVQVPHTLSDYDFGPDSVIWTAKGRERKKSVAFADSQGGTPAHASDQA